MIQKIVIFLSMILFTLCEENELKTIRVDLAKSGETSLNATFCKLTKENTDFISIDNRVFFVAEDNNLEFLDENLKPESQVDCESKKIKFMSEIATILSMQKGRTDPKRITKSSTEKIFVKILEENQKKFETKILNILRDELAKLKISKSKPTEDSDY